MLNLEILKQAVMDSRDGITISDNVLRHVNLLPDASRKRLPSCLFPFAYLRLQRHAV